MQNPSSDLPDDIDALKAMVLAWSTAFAQMQRELNARDLEIEQLKLQIAKLKQMQFGSSSEKLDRQIEQLEARLEDLQAEDGAAVAEIEIRERPARQPSVRRPLPEHLPRENRIYEPIEAECPQCGSSDWKPLGEDIAEQLSIITSAFQVIRMFETTADQDQLHRQRSGSLTRLIARGGIRKHIWPTLPGCCRRTHSPATTPSTRMVECRRPRAWRMPDVSYTICMFNEPHR